MRVYGIYKETLDIPFKHEYFEVDTVDGIIGAISRLNANEQLTITVRNVSDK